MGRENELCQGAGAGRAWQVETRSSPRPLANQDPNRR